MTIQSFGEGLRLEDSHDAGVLIRVLVAAVVRRRLLPDDPSVTAAGVEMSMRFRPHVLLGEPLDFPQDISPEATRALGALCTVAARNTQLASELVDHVAGEFGVTRDDALRQMERRGDPVLYQVAMVAGNGHPEAVAELSAVLEPMGVMPVQQAPAA